MDLNKVLDKIEEAHRSFLNDNNKPNLAEEATKIISEYEKAQGQDGVSVTKASSFLTLIPRERFISGLKSKLERAQKNRWRRRLHLGLGRGRYGCAL